MNAFGFLGLVTLTIALGVIGAAWIGFLVAVGINVARWFL